MDDIHAGQPLNPQLTSIRATPGRATRTATVYRLYALPGEPARQASNARFGRWPGDRFGRFVAGIPAPLRIGKVRLEDGATVCGFICEPLGIDGAEDITRYGAWRKYQESRRQPERR